MHCGGQRRLRYPEPEEDDLVKILKSSVACSEGPKLVDAVGDKPAYIGVFYDSKVARQASSRPRARIAYLQNGHMKKMIASTLAAFPAVGEEGAPELPDKVAWFLCDAGKQGSEASLMEGFRTPVGNKSMKKDKHIVYVNYSEESIMTRLKVAPGVTPALSSSSPPPPPLPPLHPPPLLPHPPPRSPLG